MFRVVACGEHIQNEHFGFISLSLSVSHSFSFRLFFHESTAVAVTMSSIVVPPVQRRSSRIKCIKTKINKIDNYQPLSTVLYTRWKSMRHLLDQYRFHAWHCQRHCCVCVCVCAVVRNCVAHQQASTRIRGRTQTKTIATNRQKNTRRTAAVNDIKQLQRQTQRQRKMYRNQPTIFISFQSI